MSAPLPLWADALASVLVIIGAAFALVGAIGLAKFSDFFKRLHAPSKATTLGVGCLLLASLGVSALQGQGSLHELLITLFLFVTAPVAAHLLVKAALQLSRTPRPPRPRPPAAAAAPSGGAPSAAGTESPRPAPPGPAGSPD